MFSCSPNVACMMNYVSISSKTENLLSSSCNSHKGKDSPFSISVLPFSVLKFLLGFIPFLC